MGNKKRCIAQFTFYDRTGIQEYLEKMASKGWLLEKVNNFYWQFIRIEPKKIHFAVTYFPKASAYDPEPGEEQKRLYEFCEKAGWKFVATTAQLQIFCNEEEDPIPIETDALVELENIHTSAKRNFLIAYGVLLACAFLQVGMLISDFLRDPLYVLGSNGKLFGAVCWIAVMIMCLREILGYFFWYRKAKAAAELDGSFVKTRGSRRFQLGLLAFVMVLFVLYLLSLSEGMYRFTALLSICWMILLFGLVHMVHYILKKVKASREVNRILTIATSFIGSFGMLAVVVAVAMRASAAGWFEKEEVETYVHNGREIKLYHDELPLTIEDMLEIDYKNYSYRLESEKSPFLAHYEAYQSAYINSSGVPEMRYDIYEVRIPGLYDYCLNVVMEDFVNSDTDGMAGYHFEEADASAWGAEKVYQYCGTGYGLNRYLVCYDKYFVRITFYFDVTEEQISRAGEQLRNFK